MELHWVELSCIVFNQVELDWIVLEQIGLELGFVFDLLTFTLLQMWSQWSSFLSVAIKQSRCEYHAKTIVVWIHACTKHAYMEVCNLQRFIKKKSPF